MEAIIPFRFENMWLLCLRFKDCISTWWRGCQVVGWERNRFMQMFQDIKAKLKIWNMDTFGDIKEGKEAVLRDIARIDSCEGK